MIQSLVLHLIFVMIQVCSQQAVSKDTEPCLLPACYKDVFDVVQHEAEEGSQCNSLYLALDASARIVEVWTDGANTANRG